MLIRLKTILISSLISFLFICCSKTDYAEKKVSPAEIARNFLIKRGFERPVLLYNESYFINYFTARDSVYEGVGDSIIKYEVDSPYKQCRKSFFCTQLLIARDGLVFIPFQIQYNPELGGEKGVGVTAVIVDTLLNYAVGNLNFSASGHSGVYKYDSSVVEPYDLKYKEKSVSESRAFLDSLKLKTEKRILSIKDSLSRYLKYNDSMIFFDFNALDLYYQNFELKRGLTDVIVDSLLKKESKKIDYFCRSKLRNDTLELATTYFLNKQNQKVFICINEKKAWLSSDGCVK